jgi:RNA polymerase sigma-70 factor (ECF subfamily)
METDLDLLLEKTAKGDQQAFKKLYDNIAPKALGFLMRMLNDRHAAEDVLQEAMLQVWRKAAEFDARLAKSSTWIIAIARNRALDLLRKTNRFDELLMQQQSNITDILYQQNPDLEANTTSAKTEDLLQGCMNNIGNDPAACIQLAYINGFSFREIADQRKQPLNTVKSWVRRGMQKLGECMNQ